MINRLPLEFRAPNGAPAAPNARPNAQAGIGERLLDRASACIGEYPTASLTAAVVAGLVLGRLVKSL